MAITVKVITGPDPAFLYLHGSDPDYPAASQTRSIALAEIASGALTIAEEKAALVSDVTQSIVNLQAAEAALQEL